MANTFTLNLENQDTATTSPQYDNRLEEDRLTNANASKIDAWVGKATGSFQTMFYVSGALSTLLGNAQPYGGIAVAEEDRVITQVSLVMAVTGTAGVTTFDVLLQENIGNTPTTIFRTDAVRPHRSASQDATNLWDVSYSRTFLTSSWGKGKALIAHVKEAGTAASTAALIIHWKPSASYGS